MEIILIFIENIYNLLNNCMKFIQDFIFNVNREYLEYEKLFKYMKFRGFEYYLITITSFIKYLFNLTSSLPSVVLVTQVYYFT